MSARLPSLGAALLALAACGSTPDETPFANAAGGAGVGAVDAAGVDRDLVAGDVVPGSQQDLEVNVGQRVFFDYDSSVVNGEAQATLQRQAAWLEQNPGVTVTIEGHTDERGTREYNLALGDRRADAARDYLEALGVDATRLTLLSYGEERPLDPGSDERAWAQNRRAETVVNALN